MPRADVQRFTIADVARWTQADSRQIFGGEVLGESSGAAMSVSWWRLGAGVDSVATTPADEVWVVRRGALTIHAEGEMVHLRTGDGMLLPRAAPAVAEAEGEGDSEFLVVAHPPTWQLDDDAWAAVREGPLGGTPPAVRAPLRIHPERRLDDEDVVVGPPETWPVPIGDGFGFQVRVGRAAAGATAPLQPSGPAGATDELVVVTSGALTVRTGGVEPGDLRIQEGEVAYLPAGSRAALHAAGDTDVVFLHLVVADPGPGGHVPSRGR